MIMVGNWKSQICSREIISWLEGYQEVKGVEQVILAPFPYLHWISEMKRETGYAFRLGAQDVGVHENVVTGEVSASMLTDCGVEVVCIGHSETRRSLSLSTNDLARRFEIVASHHMMPLLCVSDVGEVGKGPRWLDALPETLPNCWIAYEPEWAIGQKNAAPPSLVEDHLGLLDEAIKKRYNNSVNENYIRWMYGGAVNVDNIHALSRVRGLNGFLVGRSSLKSSDWSALIQCI